jgi:hypothetical protein
MLRKGIVALMIAVMSVASVQAEETDGKNQTGLMGFLRRQAAAPVQAEQQPSAVRHAVAADISSEGSAIQQTSGGPAVGQLQQAQNALSPLPIQQPGVVPNTSAVSGPQYFSATNGAGHVLPLHPGQNWQQYSQPVPVHRTSGGPYHFASNSVSNSPATGSSPMSSVGTGPHTGAALYPAPIPGIPQQIGGTAIPTQAFHPHEMLYSHHYKAMYPPYYYKVNGGWIVTPWGVWSKENWKLQGTEVDVKYHSHISPWAMFKTPGIR